MTDLSLDLVRRDLHDRARAWVTLHPDERRRRAVQACAEKDAEALWSLVEAYLTQHAQSGVLISRHTLLSYRTGVRQLVDHMTNRAWKVLGPEREDAQGWVGDLIASGKSISTVQARVAAGITLYKALRWAGATKAVPFEDVRLPRDRRHPLEKNAPYSESLVAGVLTRARDAYGEADTPAKRSRQLEVWALLLVLTHSGLRIDEALSLRWPDVDAGDDEPHLVVQSGKGRKSRVVPISPRLADALHAYRGAARTRRHREDYIFPYRTWQGAAYHVRPLFARRDGGNDFRGFHAFRKYMGSRLYEALGDFVAVAEVLGHANVNTTRGYVRVGVRRARQAIREW